MRFDGRLLGGIGVLSAVVEGGSFVRAGEALGLTQPAISRAVARLEERVGVRIFHRSARSVRLTEEGRRFYEQVLPHLHGIEAATMQAAGATAEVRGRLRVSTDGAFGHHVLAPRMQPLLDRHPDLSVEVVVQNGVGDLVAEGFDLGIHFGPPERSPTACRLLAETRVLTCASPAYLERHGTPRHPQELERGHQCILMRDPATGGTYAWEFIKGKRTIAVKARGRLTVSDTGTLLGACLGGQGIAQPLELYSRHFLAKGSMVELLPSWANETFPLYLYHHSPKAMPAKTTAFLAYVEELIRLASGGTDAGMASDPVRL